MTCFFKDITKCIFTGVGLFVGCVITGAETTLANDDFNEYCNDNPYNTDNNEACHHLQNIYHLLIVVTVSKHVTRIFIPSCYRSSM